MAGEEEGGNFHATERKERRLLKATKKKVVKINLNVRAVWFVCTASCFKHLPPLIKKRKGVGRGKRKENKIKIIGKIKKSNQRTVAHHYAGPLPRMPPPARPLPFASLLQRRAARRPQWCCPLRHQSGTCAERYDYNFKTKKRRRKEKKERKKTVCRYMCICVCPCYTLMDICTHIYFYSK